ncbi:Multidrug efflux pump subunit AcrA precursor [compost metagenome]
MQLVNADNKIEKRPIQLGQALGAQWLVLGGLKAGDRVMVDGFQKARVGQAVTPVAMRVDGSRVVEAQASAPAAQAAASAPPKP